MTHTGRRTRIVGGCILIGVLALGAAGCASRDSEVDSLSATQGLPSTRVDLEAGDWLLVRADSTLKVADANPITLTADNDQVSGTAPCNAYRGELDLHRESVEITNIASTKRLCKPATMQSEKEYFTALEAVDTIHINDDADVLVLSNSDKDVHLEFRDFDPRDHIVGKWSVTNVIDEGALQSVRTGTQPTITFANDDSVVVVTGCNDASTSWTLEGDLLTFDAARQTQKACPGPGVMQQEVALTKALEAAHSVDISPTTLTILNKQGDIVMVATK